MREIKFDIKIRDIETGNTFREIFTLDEIISGSKLYAKGIQEVVFKRQFTGLKDKNGKEIYEGDICVEINSICKISFVNGAFIPEWLNSGWSNYTLNYHCSKLEVIGNIYENPELLP